MQFIWMVQRVFFGPLNNEKNKNLKDLSLREMIVLLPFIIAVFWIGIFPQSYLNKMDKSVTHYVEQHQPDILKVEHAKPHIEVKTSEEKVIHTEHK